MIKLTDEAIQTNNVKRELKFMTKMALLWPFDHDVDHEGREYFQLEQQLEMETELGQEANSPNFCWSSF